MSLVAWYSRIPFQHNIPRTLRTRSWPNSVFLRGTDDAKESFVWQVPEKEPGLESFSIFEPRVAKGCWTRSHPWVTPESSEKATFIERVFRPHLWHVDFTGHVIASRHSMGLP